jgi:cellulose synthase/poly-beta-1,6-N-acetylglucosamine synthase-like glycosyltransferase
MTRRLMGEVLLERGLITRAVLDERLVEHLEAGAPLGRILMVHGDVTRPQLWSVLAETWGVDTVDLVTSPPDEHVLDSIDVDVMLEQHWVPVSVTGTTVTVAASDEPCDTMAGSVVAEFDKAGWYVKDVTFLATTDWDIEQAVLAGRGETLVTKAAYELADRRPELSAEDPIVAWQKAAGVLLAVAAAVVAVIDWRAMLLVGLLALNAAFTIGIVFKVITCVLGMSVGHRGHRYDDTVGDDSREHKGPGADIPDDELPVYTILVPAYGEANVVAEVVCHVSALDYPLSKLQVLLLLEADDIATIEAAKAARPPDYVRIVVVPPGGPQTKPKACNVGLAMAEGEYLVIFDAEDRPEPGQLREVVAAFRDASDDVVCFQARLNYFNIETNILTRMFTLEYSLWFDEMLPGLDAMGLPIPLGGTSNHFRTQALRDLGGWDPFNVTEDADLGVRAAALHQKVGIVESTTWEEACSEWKAWIRQRTRWIKGYMVTSLVQLRSPVQAWRRLGLKGMCGLLGLIVGTPLLFLAAPLMWAFFLYTFLGGAVPQFALPDWAKTVTFLTLVVGNTVMIALTALAARRRANWRLAAYALLNPVYWTLHSIAAWRALFQLVVKPAHWEKTPHGIVHGPEAVGENIETFMPVHAAEVVVAAVAHHHSDRQTGTRPVAEGVLDVDEQVLARAWSIQARLASQGGGRVEIVADGYTLVIDADDGVHVASTESTGEQHWA